MPTNINMDMVLIGKCKSKGKRVKTSLEQKCSKNLEGKSEGESPKEKVQR